MSRLDSLAKGAKLGLCAFARWGNGTDGTTTQEYQTNQLEQNDDKPSANLNTSSSRASRGRKFQKKEELYSKERICL